MKRLGLFLLAVVMAAGMTGCGGGDSGPTGSTTDFSGRWEVTFNGDDVFEIQATQAADGTLTGFHNTYQTTSEITGKVNGSEVEWQVESNMDDLTFTIYSCKVTLRGDTFDGTCTYVSLWVTKEDKQVTGKRI